jgi:CDP-2,3-bis-(O-geranylgeranyl)-sn-glycerol synthase
MIEFIAKCIYFMVPAYFANMAPIIAKGWFRGLAIPIDFGANLNNKPLFGKNKTFRGLIFGILFAVVMSFGQRILYVSSSFFRGISFFDYTNWLAVGFLMGFGAILGDLVESFFKRRIGIKPGSRFVPWDQLDFVLGALILVSIVFKPSLPTIVTILLISFVLHMLVNHAAYYLKIRKEKW